MTDRTDRASYAEHLAAHSPLAKASLLLGETVAAVDAQRALDDAEAEIDAAYADMPNTHFFGDTDEMRSALGRRSDIRDGDVLVMPGQGVIVVLAGARMIPVTEERGGLDLPAHPVDVHRYGRGLDRAVDVAREYRFELDGPQADLNVKAREAAEQEEDAASTGRYLVMIGSEEHWPSFHDYGRALRHAASYGLTASAIRDTAPAAHPALSHTKALMASPMPEPHWTPAGGRRGESVLDVLADAFANRVEPTMTIVDVELAPNHWRLALQRPESAPAALGSAPKWTDHPDVIAARHALEPLLPALVADDYDPDDAPLDMRGYMVEPRDEGTVRVYWIADGRPISARDSAMNDSRLSLIADKLIGAGWETARSGPCIYAVRSSREATDLGTSR
ncbi:hypothetical protein [Kitasatospora sp. NPDC058046]|uniref:hypothetical protein n=1 Tax=Kitasatospora sp. NPDC058046 TaxID=3346312 RepID=UPI0036DD3EAF